jgi:hypothetical protein
MKARVEYCRSAGPRTTAVQQNSKQAVRLLTTLSPSLGADETRLHAVPPGRTTKTASRTERFTKSPCSQIARNYRNFIAKNKRKVTPFTDLGFKKMVLLFNPLIPELNPSAQRGLTRVFTGDFAS